MPKAKPTQPARPETLQTIDPTDLSQVSGGVSSSGSNAEITQALSGVIDSLQSLQTNRQQGMDPTTMMMFMMMMGGGGGGSAPAPAPAYAPNTIGGYSGYTIDGVYYPFFK